MKYLLVLLISVLVTACSGREEHVSPAKPSVAPGEVVLAPNSPKKAYVKT